MTVDLTTDLMQIGFTEYEAKVYLALLRENPATGYQVSKQSGVPRSMVYDALSRLHARGAVLECIEDRATLYRPIAPDLLITRQEEKQRQLLADLRHGLSLLYTVTDDERIWTISGRRLALTYAQQMINRAQLEVFLVLMDEDIDALLPEITAACQRGIEVSILLVGKRDLDCGQVAHHPPLESALQGLIDTLLVVTDSQEALIASKGRDMRATITHNPNFVLIARQFVWMELFTQRIYARLAPELLERLDPEDRQIFESLDHFREASNGKKQMGRNAQP